MSDTYLWSFGFRGRGMPQPIRSALNAVATNREAQWGDLDSDLFPDLPIREPLCNAAFACLRGSSVQFSPGVGEDDFFFWRNSVALHDDLATQGEEFFFPWLCQYAARDGFFGTVVNDVGAAPSLLFALDGACVWLRFEKGKYGYPAGALGPDDLKRVLDATDGGTFHDVEVDNVRGTLSRRQWSDMAALFG